MQETHVKEALVEQERLNNIAFATSYRSLPDDISANVRRVQTSCQTERRDIYARMKNICT